MDVPNSQLTCHWRQRGTNSVRRRRSSGLTGVAGPSHNAPDGSAERKSRDRDRRRPRHRARDGPGARGGGRTRPGQRPGLFGGR
jgi:hypothetical protein